MMRRAQLSPQPLAGPPAEDQQQPAEAQQQPAEVPQPQQQQQQQQQQPAEVPPPPQQQQQPDPTSCDSFRGWLDAVGQADKTGGPAGLELVASSGQCGSALQLGGAGSGALLDADALLQRLDLSAPAGAGSSDSSRTTSSNSSEDSAASIGAAAGGKRVLPQIRGPLATGGSLQPGTPALGSALRQHTPCSPSGTDSSAAAYCASQGSDTE